MKLINCKACSKEISPKAHTCIHCGHPTDYGEQERRWNYRTLIYLPLDIVTSLIYLTLIILNWRAMTTCGQIALSDAASFMDMVGGFFAKLLTALIPILFQAFNFLGDGEFERICSQIATDLQIWMARVALALTAVIFIVKIYGRRKKFISDYE